MKKTENGLFKLGIYLISNGFSGEKFSEKFSVSNGNEIILLDYFCLVNFSWKTVAKLTKLLIFL